MLCYVNSSLVHLMFTTFLIASFLVPHLILCCFINLVQSKCTISLQQCTVYPEPSCSFTSKSLTHPKQLPVLQAPFMVSALYRCSISTFYTKFLLYLFLLRYIQVHNTYHCVTVAYTIHYMLYRFVAQKQQAIPYSQVCNKLDNLGLHKCTL